jgi:hypothetical protein
MMLGLSVLAAATAAVAWMSEILVGVIEPTSHPLRDGANGGQFMAVTLPDGTQFGNVNAAPSAEDADAKPWPSVGGFEGA